MIPLEEPIPVCHQECRTARISEHFKHGNYRGIFIDIPGMYQTKRCETILLMILHDLKTNVHNI